MAARDNVGLQVPTRVTVFSVRMGGPAYTYLIVTPFEKWGDVDGWASNPQVLTKAYGEVESTKLMATVRSSVEANRSEVYRIAPELSTNLKVLSPPAAFAVVTRTEVEPGMGQAYQMAVSKLKAGPEKSGNFPTVVRYVAVHGTTPTYASAQPFNKFSEREGGPNLGEALEKMFGDNETRWVFDTIAKATKHRESYIVAYRPELSWMRKATTSSQ